MRTISHFLRINTPISITAVSDGGQTKGPREAFEKADKKKVDPQFFQKNSKCWGGAERNHKTKTFIFAHIFPPVFDLL